MGRFLARLIDWQRLLMRYSTGVLSRESQQGLWGELWTLREVVGPAVGFAAAMQAWRGPLAADQDFQLPGAALEVKTSTAHVFERLAIASERQLDVESDIWMAVIALSLDARPGYGETLSEMVRQLRSIAAAASCQQLLEGRLELSGYRNEDEDSYSDVGYTVRSRPQFRIRDDFPRIVSSDLRPGVGEVRYTVALTACAPFQISEEELSDLVGRGR
ncbi:MAG: PD-(D/E)XK motif protein [SAR324 cluster bacterium]|nr:PD-(D/E)XK motif protein [SAR324 cluster bacterium]